MDYNQLIALAENKAKMATDSIKKVKPKCAGPDPNAVEKFLINKRLKEIREEEEKRTKVAKLLSLRQQNTKSNKKAKLMASRTKDNDYSKIVLTDKDIQNKERIDAQLRHKGIDDKLDRMKQRIELDQEEEDNPTRMKRKKKPYQPPPVVTTEDTGYNYSYDKIKKNRDEIFKKPSTTTNAKSQSSKPQSKPPSSRPPTYEELLKLAEQQREKKKTLEQEIEEELLAKKNKNDKEEFRKKDELYQKISLSKKKSNVEPIRSSSSSSSKNGQPTRESNSNYSSASYGPSSSKVKSNHQSDPVPKTEKPTHHLEATPRKEIKCGIYSAPPSSQSRKDDLPPISQVIKRSKDAERAQQEGSSARSNIESILSNTKSGGSLAAKIASLSKEELLALSSAVKKAKKEKKSLQEEYSPRAYSNHEEYRPSDFKSRPSSKLPSKSTAHSEPVYVPTKIKSDKRSHEDEYCPVSNYKSLSKSTEKKPSQRTNGATSTKLFDIDSLTPDEIEKIRKERMEKQRQEEAASKLAREKMLKSSKSSSSQVRQHQPPKPSTSRVDSRGRNLLPIGATYRHGDYGDANYSSNYADEDEEYEDEEDDDMRDFIDDGDDYETQQEVSKAIQELFPRYNKNRYQYFDDDDEDIEESSYAQQMKEEIYSSRVGYLEDLEEERKEQEEKRRKRRKGIISSDEDD